MDFLVVANGACQQAYWPDYLRKAQFEAGGGQVVHTAELGNLQQLSSKKALVLGEGPSAIEVATQMAITSHYPVVHVMRPEVVKSFGRKPRWGRRRTRGGQAVNLDPIEVSALIRERVKGPLATQYLSLLQRGKITPVAGEMIAYTEQGIELRSGKTIDTQVVVLGTGYRIRFPFFSRTVQSQLQNTFGAISLYRGMLPPGLDRVAFLGLNRGPSATFTSELGAYWLGESIFGYIPVPGIHEQRAQAAALAKLVTSKEGHHQQGTYLGNATEEYVLSLLSDMRMSRMSLTNWRKGTRREIPADLYQRLRQQTPHPLYFSPNGRPKLLPVSV
ncbi:MAG: hypothetical protein AAFQ98_09975 [Bacteroidota bacterium]